LIVPILVDARQSEKEVGQLTIAGSSVADFAAVVLVSVFFSSSGGGIGAKVVLFVGFALLAVVAVLTLSRIGRSMRLGKVLDMRQDATAEIRIRMAVVVLIAFVVLASHFGLEAILGAFVAGFVVNLIDNDSDGHPNFRVKLDAIGYGFLVPVFFVVSGLHFDLRGLVHSPAAFARIPLFLGALFVVRAGPALLYRSVLSWRGVLAAGFLQATSLPFLVTVSMIGVTLGTIKPITGSALVAAGVLSCMIFPLASLSLLRPDAAVYPETDLPGHEGRPAIT
jgi:Kef-type K+ transport system membrane component KefB